MKFLTHFISGILILTYIVACDSNNVLRTYQDEFKGSTRYVLSQIIYPSERRSVVASTVLTYEKEILPSKSQVVNIYFVLSRGTSSIAVDRKGFLKIGEKTFDIVGKNTQTELKRSEMTTIDSSGVATTDVSNWMNDQFKITLSPEMIDLLQKDNLMTLRFYAGPHPITLIVGDINYKKLRGLLTKT